MKPFTTQAFLEIDYYPFGMVMPGRKFDAESLYRYGFNGKENDNEVKGEGNQQDYGMRIYDPRTGRFLSLDPFTDGFPFYSPYQFAGNMPLWAIDFDGGEPKGYHWRWNSLKNGSTVKVIDSYATQNGLPIIYKVKSPDNVIVYEGALDMYLVQDVDEKYYWVYETFGQHDVKWWAVEGATVDGQIKPVNNKFIPFEWSYPGEHDADLASKTALFWYGIFAGGALAVSVAEGELGAATYQGIKQLTDRYKKWKYQEQNKKLLEEGNKVDRNKLTKAGRALQKHSDRKKTAYEKPVGGKKPEDYNRAGEAELKKILDSEGRMVRPNKDGGKDYKDPSTGKGARFKEDGSFEGFLEP